MDEQRTIHLRYGVIVAYNKHCRFVIARVDTQDHALVFLREWDDDPDEGYDVYYSLYKAALTADEADEILILLKNGVSGQVKYTFFRHKVHTFPALL